MSVFLSVLLVVTMFDVPAAMALGDALQGQSRQDQAHVNAPSDSGSSDAQHAEGSGSSGSSDTDGSVDSDKGADSSDGSNDNSSGNGSQGSDQQGAGSDSDAADDASQGASGNDAPAGSNAQEEERKAHEAKQAALKELLPSGLVDASAVLPSVGQDDDSSKEQKKANEALAKKLEPKLLLAGTVTDDKGRHLIKDRTATLLVAVPDAERTLQGGHIGASEKRMGSDVFTFQIDAPAFYKNDDGTFTSTLSQEEWRYHKGNESGARVKLSADKLPDGWSLYTLHDGKYAKVSAKDLKEKGVFGTIVLRWDGTKQQPRKLEALTAMPAFDLSIEGDLPHDQEADLGFGWSFASWTTAEGAQGEDATPLFGKVSTHEQKAEKLLAERTESEVGFDVKQLAQTRTADMAWANLLVSVESKNADAQSALLSVLDGRDKDGRNGLADGVRAFDVTGQASQVESLEGLSADALKDAGFTELAVKQDGGSAHADVAGFKAGEVKQFVLSVPYDAHSIDNIADVKNAPDPVSLRVSFDAKLSNPKGGSSLAVSDQTVQFSAAPEQQQEGQGEEGDDAGSEEGDGQAEEGEGDGSAEQPSQGQEPDEGDGPYDPVANDEANDLPKELSAAEKATAKLAFARSAMPLQPRAAGDVLRPDLFSPYVQVGTTGTNLGNNQFVINNESLASTTVTLGATLGFDNGYLGGSLSDAVALTVKIPYLYRDADGGIQSVYDKDKWNELKGSSDNDMFIAMRPNATTMDNWLIYEGDYVNNNSDNPTLATPQVRKEQLASGGKYEKGLVGTFTFIYIGTGGTYRLGQEYAVPTFSPYFYGDIPENSGGTIELYSKITRFHDNNDGSDITGKSLVGPGDTHLAGFRTAVLLKTNLEWELNVKNISTPVLWDRYNYQVYKIDVVNTSPNEDAVIDRLSLFFNPLSAALDYGEGIRQEDLMAWKVDENGNVTANWDTDPTKQGEFIGKPMEGGILIYDTTDWDQSQYDALDTSEFSNVGGLEPIRYSTGGRAGYLFFEMDEPEGRLVSNNFVRDDGSVPDNNDHRSFIVAMPYTTNIKHVGTGDNMQYTRAKLDTTATVYFGNRGEADYSWSVGDLRHDPFQVRKAQFSQRKSGVDLPSGGRYVQAPYAAKGYLGRTASYVIDQMSFTSNVPLFSPLTDPKTGLANLDPTSAGPMMVDTIPNRFTVTGFDITMPKQSISDPATGLKDTELSDWYSTAKGVIEVEVADASGATSWVNLGNPTKVSDDGTNVVWRLGVDDEEATDPGIDDMLKGQGITPTPGTSSSLSRSFTGKVRFNFAYRILKDVDIPGSITVHGLMEDQGSPSNPTKYENVAEMQYGLRMWSSDINDDGSVQGGYYVSSQRSNESKGILQPVVVDPRVVARSFTKSTEPADATVNESQKRTESILNQEGAGYRFHLSNASQSKMIPATIDVRTLYGVDSNRKRWFDATDVTFSAEMLAGMKIDSVTFDYYALNRFGQWVSTSATYDWATLQTRGALDAAGNLTFDPGVWNNGKLAGFNVKLTQVEGMVPSSGKDAFVEVRGVPTDKKEMPLSCTFSTDYGQPSWDKSATDTATIVGVTPPFKPVVTADTYTAVSQPADASALLNDKTQVSLSTATARAGASPLPTTRPMTSRRQSSLPVPCVAIRTPVGLRGLAASSPATCRCRPRCLTMPPSIM